MERTGHLIQPAWVCAVMAPYAVSPHPNFSQEEVDGPGLLGLVAQLRIADYERYRELLRPESPDWVSDLVEAASMSVTETTIQQGAVLLWKFSEDDTLPFGARVAAAIFASVAQVELDEPEVAVEGLKTLLSAADLLTETRSLSLARRALLIQLAVREYELREIDSAQLTLRTLGTMQIPPMPWEKFEVSKGVSWKSDVVQRDVLDAVQNHLRMMESTVEDIDGDKWVDVVRSRISWPDTRILSQSGQRDREFVNQRYLDEMGVRPKKMIISSGDPVLLSAWASLLAAELSGNPYEIRRCRLGLAQTRLMIEGDHSSAAQDGLRLLRLTEDREALEAAIQNVQSRGPNRALADDARVIVSRSSFPSRVTESDIITVSSAANFLLDSELRLGLQAAFSLLRSPKRRGFQDERALWGAVTRLLVDSNADAQVARETIEILSESRDIRIIENTIQNLLGEITWEEIPESTKMAWGNWGESQLRAGNVKELAAQAAVIGGTSIEEIHTELSDFEIATFILNHQPTSDHVPDQVLRRACSGALHALSEIRRDSQSGGMSIGGYDPGTLAVGLAVRFDVVEVWRGVVEMLTDINVDGYFKTGAIDRMSHHVDKLPQAVRTDLGAGWAHIMETKFRDHPFAEEILPYFTEAIRLGAALGLVARDDAVVAITELSGGSRRSRIAASVAVPVISHAFHEEEWGQVVLLQLTTDAAPEVRALAANGLALIGSSQSSMTEIARRRLLTLLRTEGIRIPLRTLHGLQQAAQEGWGYDHQVEDAVAALALESPARVLRNAAHEVLRRIEMLTEANP